MCFACSRPRASSASTSFCRIQQGLVIIVSQAPPLESWEEPEQWDSSVCDHCNAEMSTWKFHKCNACGYLKCLKCDNGDLGRDILYCIACDQKLCESSESPSGAHLQRYAAHASVNLRQLKHLLYFHDMCNAWHLDDPTATSKNGPIPARTLSTTI